MATTSSKRRLTSTAPPVIRPADLPRMSQEELDALFSRSTAGPTPSGVGDGIAIVAPGTPVAAGLAALIHLPWQGKVFYPEQVGAKTINFSLRFRRLESK